MLLAIYVNDNVVASYVIRHMKFEGSFKLSLSNKETWVFMAFFWDWTCFTCQKSFSNEVIYWFTNNKNMLGTKNINISMDFDVHSDQIWSLLLLILGDGDSIFKSWFTSFLFVKKSLQLFGVELTNSYRIHINFKWMLLIAFSTVIEATINASIFGPHNHKKISLYWFVLAILSFLFYWTLYFNGTLTWKTGRHNIVIWVLKPNVNPRAI